MKKSMAIATLMLIAVLPFAANAQGMMHGKQDSTQTKHECKGDCKGECKKGKMHGKKHGAKHAQVNAAVSVLHPTEGSSVHGTVWFRQTDEGVKVTAKVEGLTPGKHGFHIHQFGNTTAPDGTSAGGHFNPMKEDHAGPMDEMRHAGDLGNLEANEDGVATYEWTDRSMMFHGPMSILGRGLVVHAGEDDLKSQPTGAAGARVAVGVIGVAE